MRTNLGFGRGGATRPPRYVASGRSAWAGSRFASCPDATEARSPNERATILKQTKRRCFLGQLWVNNDRPFHAELVMNGTDVIESAWRCEGHPKTRYTWKRLGEPCPILWCRRQKSRVHAVRR